MWGELPNSRDWPFAELITCGCRNEVVINRSRYFGRDWRALAGYSVHPEMCVAGKVPSDLSGLHPIAMRTLPWYLRTKVHWVQIDIFRRFDFARTGGAMAKDVDVERLERGTVWHETLVEGASLESTAVLLRELVAHLRQN